MKISISMAALAATLLLGQAAPGERTKERKASDVSPAASLIDAQKAGVDTHQISVPAANVAAETPSASGVDTLFNCTWSAAPVVSAPLLDSPTVAVGGFMYLFGGVQGGAISAASFKFDGTTWTPIAALPAALEFPAAVTDGTNCYILGGALTGTGTPQTTLYRYNVAANTYTTLAPFTTGTWNHAAVFLNGKIYKFCGTGPATSSTNVLEIYNVAANTWSPGASYPITESFVGAWGQGNFIYACGGIDGATSVATLKTYRYDTTTNTWDDASIADLPATRWGAAAALYTDGVLAGGYVGGVATANISNSVLSWDLPTNTWQAVPNLLQARSRMTGAVLNNNLYVVGGRCTTAGVCDGFQGTTDNQKLLCLNMPTNIITNGGSMIVSAGGNGVLDPGETVTVSLGAQNSGGPGVVCTTAALAGTLQVSGGVTNPSGPTNYGVMCSPPTTTSRNFTFTVDPMLACGATVTVTLHMQDGATDYGNLTYTFVTGTSAVAFSQNWDGVVAPALPAGWTTSATGIGVPWVTSTSTPFSAPNEAFAPDPDNIGDSMLVSPTFAVPAGGATLTFKNSYNTENTFDGEVLEISINGGAFADIITAGGTFVTGGYTGVISSSFSSPIAGRQAWSGNSGGYITSTVTLPPAANGQMAQLKWRMASDSSVAAVGVMIDDISISNPVCAPAASSAVARKVHGAAGPLDINLPLAGGGIECRSGGGTNDYQVVFTFPSAVTFTNATVTAGTGSVGSSSGNGTTTITVNLTGVTNAQQIVVTLHNVNNGAATGDVSVQMGVLVGDVNGDGFVNSVDISQAKAKSGQTVDASNLRNDVIADGSFNSADVSLVKSRSGTGLP